MRLFHIVAFIFGLVLTVSTLLDGFETILLPRRINHRFRYSRLYYRSSWKVWRCCATRGFKGKWRESMLSAYGPLSLLGLFGGWVVSLMIGFAVLHWSVRSALSTNSTGDEVRGAFTTYLYFSGTTYFTLGLGDITPDSGLARTLTVVECGVGFGFLAIIISYLPTLYGAFSRREWTISLLDARAGSPPTAGTFVLRMSRNGRSDAGGVILNDWERWCVELLETHISFPVLAFYRSQHGNQSWLAALAMMLDSSALMLTTLPVSDTHAAQFTFAMARHAVVDIGLIFGVKPTAPPVDRFPAADRQRLHDQLCKARARVDESPEAAARLTELRGMYEPFLQALANHFQLALPPVVGPENIADNWQRSPFMPHTPGIGSLPAAKSTGDHFD